MVQIAVQRPALRPVDGGRVPAEGGLDSLIIKVGPAEPAAGSEIVVEPTK